MCKEAESNARPRLGLCQKIIRSHVKFMVRSQGKKENKSEREKERRKKKKHKTGFGLIIMRARKESILFMSLIQWQDRAGHLSPTDANHL